MSKQRGFVPRPRALGCSVAALILVVALAILFPVFASYVVNYGRGASVIVYDAEKKPMPEVTLQFRNKEGAVAYTYKTDAEGRFNARYMRAISQLPVEGYLLSNYHRNTGAPGLYEFSPVATHEFTVYASDGSRVAHQPVGIYTDSRYSSFTHWERFTDYQGKVIIPDTPAVAHLEVSLGEPLDRRFAKQAVVSTKRTVQNHRILYEVHLGKPAILVGKITVDSPEKASGHYFLECRKVGEVDGSSRVLPPDGGFRLIGLPPGDHTLTLYNQHHHVVYQETITVKEGTTRLLSPIIVR